MLWSSLTLVAFLAAAPSGSIWKGPVSHSFTPTNDRALWDEYGLESAEQADVGRAKAVAYRFRDTTGAYAAWLWLKSSGEMASLDGNVVLTCSGTCPGPKALWSRIDGSQVSHAASSSLPGYLPRKGLIPGSERYILGLASLEKFGAALPAQAMAFQFSTEAAVASYQTPKGRILLAIVSYPTPAMARQQAVEFRKLNGVAVKRSGPLVMVVPDGQDKDAASVISGISYLASVSWDEKPLDPHIVLKLRDMLFAIGELILFVVGLCVIGGLAVGGVRVVRSQFGSSTAGDVIVLNLSGR